MTVLYNMFAKNLAKQLTVCYLREPNLAFLSSLILLPLRMQNVRAWIRFPYKDVIKVILSNVSKL